MKPLDVKSDSYCEYSNASNLKKIKIGDLVRILKYKDIFAKGYNPNWSEEDFVTSKIKNTVPQIYVIRDVKGEEIVGTFYKKELQETNQKEFRIEKVIERKGNNLHFKWKGYDNYFNIWIDENDKNMIKMIKISYKNHSILSQTI